MEEWWSGGLEDEARGISLGESRSSDMDVVEAEACAFFLCGRSDEKQENQEAHILAKEQLQA